MAILCKLIMSASNEPDRTIYLENLPREGEAICLAPSVKEGEAYSVYKVEGIVWCIELVEPNSMSPFIVSSDVSQVEVRIYLGSPLRTLL